jgi:molecular chaperone Hsp33
MEDNYILPFQLEASGIRGRIVRLGSVLDDILGAHSYPENVLHLTAEMTVLTGLLSSMLKYEGVFTLQAQGDGPVKMLVSDIQTGGGIRACASFHDDRLDKEGWNGNRAELLGKGYMAFTVDQGEYMERYQGIVELKPDSLVSSIQHYFTQSEQIMTGIMVAVGRKDSQWRGCGIMVQAMPEDTESYNRDLSDGKEDDWRRTMVLLGSVTEKELLSSRLTSEELLFRLFHEEGVRVYEPTSLRKTCRCGEDKVGAILATMPEDDIDEITVDGKITMTCEFCSRDYVFNPDNIKKGHKHET